MIAPNAIPIPGRVGIGITLEPTTRVPLGATLMQVPDIVVPGPPAKRVVEPMATACDGRAEMT